jgi:hypothetical protein
MRRVLRILAPVAGLSFLWLLYLLLVPVGEGGPHGFNRDRNAVWLEHRWFEKDQSPAEMEAVLTSLDRHGVRYLFPHLIPFDAAGRLPIHNREQMRAFLAAARRVDPEMKVLPWVGGVRVGYRRMRMGTVGLGDLGQRQRIVAECRGLVDEGFDGVHLDIEPVDDGNVDYLALLRALRTAVGPDHILSLSAIRPGPFVLSVAPNFFWTPDYYARVASAADQVVVMTYDTGLPTAALYSRYVSYATLSVAARLAGSKARVLVGIPTYEETGWMHRAGVETPENALRGVVAGLRDLGDRRSFEGVALYAGWTTDDAKWGIYERLWRGPHGAP